MKPVEGFMTDDGTFYETAEQAAYEEAKLTLEGLLISERIQAESFIEVTEKLHVQIATFIQAHQAFQSVTREQIEYHDEQDGNGEKYGFSTEAKPLFAQPPEDDFDTSDLPGGKEDSASIQHEQANSSEHVSDMGSGEQPTPVRHHRTQHGIRSRKSDAQRVRGSKAVAAKAQPGTTKAR